MHKYVEKVHKMASAVIVTLGPAEMIERVLEKHLMDMTIEEHMKTKKGAGQRNGGSKK